MGRGAGCQPSAQSGATRRSKKNKDLAPPPSQLARNLAERLWPDVQSQMQLAPGVYDFSCAGHGGVIAILDHANFPERNVKAARDLGFTELIGVQRVSANRRRFYATVGSNAYTRESIEKAAAAHPSFKVFEAWVGEEDCDWATIFYSDPKLIDKANAKGWGVSEKIVRNCLVNWNERFLAEVEDDYIPEPGGQIEKEELHRELVDSGAFIRVAATWHDDETTEVIFRDANGTERHYLMDAATYDAFPLDEDLTPLDYRQAGEITLLSEEEGKAPVS